LKIKVKPEDFIVEEVADISFNPQGKWTILKLTKRYWNTLELIDYISKKYRLRKEFFSRGGLKDRYSLSFQYLSYKGDIKKNIKEKNFTLEVLGKSDHPVNLNNVKGNRFDITIRDLGIDDVKKMEDNYDDLLKYGFPNYFDEQRFGSASHGMGFFGKFLLLGHYNGALKSLFYKYDEDNREIKRFKEFCIENWGNWDKIKKISPEKYRGIFEYLSKNKNDFKGAIKLIDREYLNLYLLAYQSYIFNETIKLIVLDYGEEIFIHPYKYGDFVFYKRLREFENLKEINVPVVNNKVSLEGYTGEKIKEVLKKEGVNIKMFSLNKMRFRGVRFKTFMRRFIVFPEEFFYSTGDDDLYKGKKKVNLKFFLPSGSYATILIKRLFHT